MPPIEEYLQRADELAQEVVNAWGVNMQAGNAASLTDEFKAVLDKACRYRNAKEVADNHRQFNMLSERDAGEETATRQAFAEAYKIFWERHQASA
jgi:mevalonate kinase